MTTLKTNKLRIGILGAGAFGTSLAILYSNFAYVTLFSHFTEHVDSMKKTRENEFLRGVNLPLNIEIELSFQIKKNDFDYLFWCFPVSPSLDILNEIGQNINIQTPIIICAKGFCNNDSFLSVEFQKILPKHTIGVLSGPNFAMDIALLQFSAADLAFDNIDVSKAIALDLSNKFMHLIPSQDIIGLQIAGALKNVIAIACGILSELKCGPNTLAAMLTLGLKEMSTVGTAMGANKETFYGLSGIGDLILTASNDVSRNMMFGKKLARGLKAEEILQNSSAVSEGALCINNIVNIVRKLKIDAPICQNIFSIINDQQPPSSILGILTTL